MHRLATPVCSKAYSGIWGPWSTWWICVACWVVSRPPAGIAESALDILMLHLVPPDAVHQAPSRWATVPGSLWVLFPTRILQHLGGLEAELERLDLDVEVVLAALESLRSFSEVAVAACSVDPELPTAVIEVCLREGLQTRLRVREGRCCVDSLR